MTQQPTISAERSPRRDLEQQGYAYFKGASLSLPPSLQRELSLLEQDYEHLPADQYCESGNRYRRHSRYVLLPWLDLLEPRPVSYYIQDRELNPADGGVTRTFERLSAPTEANAFLRAMILFDFSNTTFAEPIWSMPVDVGVHAIRYVARPGFPVVPTPNHLHKDGEPYTFIHLIGRRGVTGGENLVADNDKQPLVEITLTDCLDTVVVSDEDVYHHVEPIEAATGASKSYRDVLLIDFTPMRPVTLNAPSPM